MDKQSMGDMIAKLRKERGMTQKELAEKLGVTDRAVSKWERNLSCPDISSVPKLADVLGASLDTLMNAEAPQHKQENTISKIADTILKVLPLSMGAAVAVTSILGALDSRSGFTMLGIGLFCIGIVQLKQSAGDK